jgi:adenine C2-methylase RlmN of 23S rRNA A2503 and tRNA A37
VGIRYTNGYGAKAHSFEDMTNISKETRAMESNFVINHIKVDTIQRSDDGTIKNAVRLHDGLVVEVCFDSLPIQEQQPVFLGLGLDSFVLPHD